LQLASQLLRIGIISKVVTDRGSGCAVHSGLRATHMLNYTLTAEPRCEQHDAASSSLIISAG
jgi:hypothetical protein